MSRIAVLCPTRDGPERALNCYGSMIATSTDTDMVFCIDDDQAEPYAPLANMPRAKLSVAPHGGIVRACNHAVDRFRDYDIYGLAVDDSVFMTRGWDGFVCRSIDRFAGGIGVVSAHHGGGPWVNFPYVSRTWIDTLEWYACPQTYHFCWDTVLELLGDATDIIYALPEEFSMYHRGEPNADAERKFRGDASQFLGWCIDDRRRNVMKLNAARAAAIETRYQQEESA